MSVEAKAIESWGRAISRFQLPPETEALLSKTQLKQVEVSIDGSQWNLVVEGSTLLPLTAIETIKNSIRACTNTKPIVTLNQLGQRTKRISPADLWMVTVKTVRAKFPFMGSWLETATWEYGYEMLTITLGSEVATQLMKTRQADLIIRDLWAEHGYGQIDVTVDWDDDLSLDLEEELEAAKDYELQKCLAEIENKADQESPGTYVVVGEPITGVAQPISSLEDLGSSVIIEGYATKWNIHKTKKGKTLVTFDLADEDDAVTVKTLVRKREEEQRALDVSPGTWLRVAGELTFDRFSGEELVWARSIEVIEPKLRRDRAEQKRVELHLHTQMSSLDATTRLEDLFELAAQWGHQAVAITDHGSVQAFPEAYELGCRYGIKVIYGLEGYLVDDGIDPLHEQTPVYHIIILVKNQAGLKNLYRLVTLSHLEYFHRVPRLPRSVLLKHREGLLFGSACEAGELFQAMLLNAPGEELNRRAAFYDFLEIQPRENNAFLIREGRLTEKELLELNKHLVDLGEQLGKPVVATGDVHFLNPNDEVLRRVLLSGQNYSDADFQPPLYFKSTTEMLEEFDYLGQETAYRLVVEVPAAIAAVIDNVQPVPANLSVPSIPGAEAQIEQMARERAAQLYGTPLPNLVAQRLEKELNSIVANGYAVIYLIAHRLVKKSLEDGYLVGSRGSVGSSLVATLCGITEVNPLPPHYRCPKCCYSEFLTDGSIGSGYDLQAKDCPRCATALETDGQDIPFETFLGFKGDKVPDIDLNFSGEYQAKIHRYTEELFGPDRVFRAGTISTIAERTAYGFVKAYADSHGLRPRRAQIDRLVAGLCGIRRTTGQHPGGLMIVPAGQDVLDFSPVQYPADTKSDVRTTHFDYNSISDRLLKLDLLGHDDPTMLKMLEEMTGVSPQSIPLDDAKTMRLFSGVTSLGVTPEDIGSEIGSLGLPEFGTRFVRQMLLATRPKTFSELVRISGLSHGTDVWLNNAQELIQSGEAKLSEVICTRDDIMLFLMQKGLEPAWAFRIMESVRKGKGLSPEMEMLMREKGLPEWYIDSCGKIKYMFPKAHAVAYVMMAVRIGYYKVHFPAAFYASYFSVRLDDFDLELALKGPEQVRAQIAELEAKGNNASAKEKSLLTVLEVVREMFARGLDFLPLDIACSHPTRFLISDQVLLPPLMSAPGLGRTAAENIVAARTERPFSSQEDLRVRGRLARPLVKVLQITGCLGQLPAQEQLDLFQTLSTDNE